MFKTFEEFVRNLLKIKPDEEIDVDSSLDHADFGYMSQSVLIQRTWNSARQIPEDKIQRALLRLMKVDPEVDTHEKAFENMAIRFMDVREILEGVVC